MQTSVNYAATLLLALFIASALNGGSAVAQIAPYDAGNPLENVLWMFGVKRSSGEKRLEEIRTGASILTSYERAVNGLRKGDKEEFRNGWSGLVRAIHAEVGVNQKNRNMAKRLLESLPRKFENGFAFQRQDGTAVKDPDEFIRQRLVREQHSIFGGGESGGGDAD